MNEYTALFDLLTKGGLLTALGIALVGGHRGWYVWQRTHERELQAKDDIIKDKNDALEKLEKDKNEIIAKCEKDRDYWRDFSIRVLTANERTLERVGDIAQK
jgi:hypothetical protein